MEEKKAFWESKTLWANLIAAFALFCNSQWGFQISPELQVIFMGAMNAVLRMITNKPLTW